MRGRAMGLRLRRRLYAETRKHSVGRLRRGLPASVTLWNGRRYVRCRRSLWRRRLPLWLVAGVACRRTCGRFGTVSLGIVAFLAEAALCYERRGAG